MNVFNMHNVFGIECVTQLSLEFHLGLAGPLKKFYNIIISFI